MSTDAAEKFQELLLSFSQAEDLGIRQNLETELWKEFGMERAVFVLDMSGFSLITRKYGIVHYLSYGKTNAIDNRTHCQIVWRKHGQV